MAEPEPAFPSPRSPWRDLLTIAFCLTMALLIVGGIVGYLSAERLSRHNAEVRQTHEIILGLEDLLSTLKDAETGQRGYLLTEEVAYLQPYSEAVEAISTRLGTLRKLIAADPGQQERLRAVEISVQAKLEEVNRTLQLARNGNRATALEMVRTDNGKQLMDQLRREIGEMERSARDLREQRVAESLVSFRTVVWCILITAGMGLVLVGIAAQLTRRNLRLRERTAEAIAEQRERLRTTLASIGDGVLTTDEQARVTFLNPVAEALTGWASGEAMGRPMEEIFRIVNETTREKVDNPALRALREGIIVGLANHTVLQSRTGQEVPIDDSAAPIRLGSKVVGAVLVFRDVAQRRAQERTLAEAHAFLGSSLDALSAHVAVLDEQGVILLVNEAWRAFATANGGTGGSFGVGANYLLACEEGLCREGTDAAAGIRAVLSGHQTHYELEYPCHAPQAQRWFVMRVTRFGELGRFRVAVAHENVTERKIAELAATERSRLSSLRADVSSALARSVPLRSGLEEACSALTENLGLKTAAIWTIGPDEETLGLQAVSGAVNNTEQPDRIRFGEGILGRIAESKQLEYHSKAPWDQSEPGITSETSTPRFAGLPLVVEGRLAGMLALTTQTHFPATLMSDLAPVIDQLAQHVERRRAEDALSRNEEQFRTLAESIPQLCWMAHPDGTTFWFNRRFYEYFGVTPDQLGKWDRARFHDPEFMPRVLERWNHSLRTGEPFDMVFPLRGADGKFRQFLTRVVPLRDAAGNIVRWFGTNTDVSEVKRIEEQLRESEARFRQIADTMPQIVWVTRPDGYHEYFNSRWYEFVGMKEGDTDGEGWNGMFHPDDQERAWKRWRHSLETGEAYEIEYRLRHHSGDYRWFLGRALPVRDQAGAVVKWFGTCTDIEDFKQVEAERQKFVLLAENSTDFIGMCELDAVPFYINRAGLKMVGLENLEQVQQISVREFFFPEDQSRVMEEFFPAVLKAGSGEIEVRFRHFQTGAAVWMLYRVFAITSPRGPQVILATVSRDITQRRHLEDELRRLAADLSDANHRKDEFLATLAHELRNPLAPIRTGLEVLKLSGNNPSLIEEVRGTMERQTQQMVRLIDDLLDVSRITQGKLELRRCMVSLADVLRSAVEAVRPFVDEAGHQLSVLLSDEPIQLYADPNRLAQVVSNLLNNSSKYTPDAGQIRLSAYREGDEAVISVADNGIGIPAEMQDGIFEMFAQIDRPLEKGYKGLGIGLTLVKRLVEMHGGSISVQSEGANQGSEFRVRLPLQTPQSVDDSAIANGTQSRPSRKLKILVVDDNTAAADMLALVVRMLGHETFTAYDGEQGVQVADARRPDIILMDIGMPKLNGYEAARHIREKNWGRSIWLVALTGWGQEEDKQRAREAGFDQHLVKPAEPSELQRLLSGVAERTIGQSKT